MRLYAGSYRRGCPTHKCTIENVDESSSVGVGTWIALQVDKKGETKMKALLITLVLVLTIVSTASALECRLVCDFMGRCSYVCR